MKKLIFITLILLTFALFISCSLSEEEKNMDGVKMIAVIKNIDDKIEVEVVEGEYGASGIYWVITSNDTVFADSESNHILASSLKVGDTIEITYGGQVMMSYPPQIVAKKIVKIK